MRFPLIVFLLGLAATSSLSHAKTAPSEHCSDDTVCVLGEWQAGEGDRRDLVFTGRNLSVFPITITLRLSSTAFDDQPPDDLVRTVAPNATTVLTTLQGAASGDQTPKYNYRFDWDFGVAEVEHDDDYLYRMPYATGKNYRVLQGYGSRFSHTGNEYYSVDFDMPRGTPVHAAREGVVMEVVSHHGEGCWEARCRRNANFINVLHDDGSTGEYYHLLKDGAQVAVGDRVERGQFIALSGNSGHSTMPHLHFGVYEAIAWGRTRSLPARFVCAEGVITTPRPRQRYTAR